MADSRFVNYGRVTVTAKAWTAQTALLYVLCSSGVEIVNALCFFSCEKLNEVLFAMDYIYSVYLSSITYILAKFDIGV